MRNIQKNCKHIAYKDCNRDMTISQAVMDIRNGIDEMRRFLRRL